MLNEIPESVVQLVGEAAVPLAAHILANMAGREWSDPTVFTNEYANYLRAKRILLFALRSGSNDEPARANIPDIVEG